KPSKDEVKNQNVPNVLQAERVDEHPDQRQEVDDHRRLPAAETIKCLRVITPRLLCWYMSLLVSLRFVQHQTAQKGACHPCEDDAHSDPTRVLRPTLQSSKQ